MPTEDEKPAGDGNQSEELAEKPVEGKEPRKNAAKVPAEQAGEAVGEGDDREPVEGKDGSDEGVESADEGAGEPEKFKREPGSAKTKRQLIATRAELDETRRRLEEALTPPAKRKSKDPEPSEKDFPDDYLAFDRSHRAWSTRQAVKQVLSEENQEKADLKRKDAFRDAALAYDERLDEIKTKIPDFDEVVAKLKGTQVPMRLLDELVQSEKGPLLTYHLAKNPDKLQELSELSGAALAREIGRLEGSVRLPPSKGKTNAPNPPTHLRGNANVQVDPRKGPDDMDSYVAWRKKGGGM